jgi:hypothetical protein
MNDHADEGRSVLLPESLFLYLVDYLAEADGRDIQITWGDPLTTMTTYHQPVLTAMEPRTAPAPDPLEQRPPATMS